MDPMMMAIIAVVVLVLIAGAFFFMKSRGNGAEATSTPSASSNRPKTLAEQQREMEQQRLNNPVMPAAPSVSTSVTSQPTPDAIPQPAPVQAQITPVAAVNAQPDSLDFDGFDFDDKAASPAVQPSMTTATPTPHVEETLSFDNIELPSVSTPATPTVSSSSVPSPAVHQEVADELDFSFDEVEMGLSPATSPTPSVTTPVASQTPAAVPTSELDDFSFDFDEPTKPAVASTPAPQVAAVPSDSLNFDEAFSFDEPVVAPTATVTPAPVATPKVAEIEEFDFSMDEFEAAQPAPVAPPSVQAVATPAQAPEVEDFDFDFEEAPVATTQPTPAVTVPVVTVADDTLTMDDFSFEMDEVKSEPSVPPATTTATPLMTASEEMVFGLTEESRPETIHTGTAATSDTPVAPPVVEKPSAETVETFGDDFDLDFTLPEPPVASQTVTTPVTTPAEATVEEDALFDLDFDIPATAPAVVAQPVKSVSINELPTTTADSGDEYDTFNQLDNLSAAPTTPEPAIAAPQTVAAPTVASVAAVTDAVTAPVTNAPITLDNDFMSIVNGLDTAQLNIDLASQYVQLGEYDSAKRLLAEVNQANPQQQQQIDSLMDKIA